MCGVKEKAKITEHTCALANFVHIYKHARPQIVYRLGEVYKCFRKLLGPGQQQFQS
jgi:hypothetical protein